jgi:twitching motility protein PilT
MDDEDEDSDTLQAVIAQQLLPSHTGEGRVACFEVMMGTRDVRMLIRDNKTFQIPGQMQIGERWGHITRDNALARSTGS